MDDESSRQDPDTLHQVSHHVDESGPHAGVAVAVVVAAPELLGPLLAPTAGRAVDVGVSVSVRRSGLVEDRRHPAEVRRSETLITDGRRRP